MKNNIEKTDLNQLISNLKKRDRKYARAGKILQYTYSILLPLYVILCIHEINSNYHWSDIVGDLFYCTGIFMIVLMARIINKNYRYIDYSLPTLQILKQAAKRYTFLYGRKLYIIIGLSSFELGLLFRKFGDNDFLHLQTIMFLGMSCGIVIGLTKWNKLHKPLRDNANRLIKEIEGE